jgi:hypothetical protein
MEALLYFVLGCCVVCAQGALLLTQIIPNTHGLTITVSR